MISYKKKSKTKAVNSKKVMECLRQCSLIPIYQTPDWVSKSYFNVGVRNSPVILMAPLAQAASNFEHFNGVGTKPRKQVRIWLHVSLQLGLPRVQIREESRRQSGGLFHDKPDDSREHQHIIVPLFSLSPLDLCISIGLLGDRDAAIPMISSYTHEANKKFADALKSLNLQMQNMLKVLPFLPKLLTCFLR